MGGFDDDLCPDGVPGTSACSGLARSAPISGVCDLMARLPSDKCPVGLSGLT